MVPRNIARALEITVKEWRLGRLSNEVAMGIAASIIDEWLLLEKIDRLDRGIAEALGDTCI